MSKQVPTDQVAILLNIQGIDDMDEVWNEDYNKLHKKMNLHLPEFYFSILPSYKINTKKSNHDVFEQKFINGISSKKYTKDFIKQLLSIINTSAGKTRRTLLSSTNLDLLKTKINSIQDQLPKEMRDSLIQLIESSPNQICYWHYPVISFNGFQNQYHKWIQNIIKGDFGISLSDTRPVTDKLWEAMKWSVLLVLLNLIFALIFAFPIGVYNGMRPNSPFDNISNGILFAFFAIPKFWLATLFVIFFTTAEYGGWTNIFPSVGIWYQSGDQSFFSMLMSSWQMLILPLLMLVIPDIAYLGRLIRSSIQEESNKEYVKTALSKGLSIKDITTKHILPNSLIPTVSLIVGTLPGAIASSLVIEVIFNIPGIGRLMFVSIENADWPIVYPIVLIISVFAVLLFLFGDVLMAYLNPKIKLGS